MARHPLVPVVSVYAAVGELQIVRLSAASLLLRGQLLSSLQIQL